MNQATQMLGTPHPTPRLALTWPFSWDMNLV